jgi:hypothetical protein
MPCASWTFGSRICKIEVPEGIDAPLDCSFIRSTDCHSKEASLLILRWFHFIAGILWIGLLYFFNLVNMPFMKTWMRLPNRRSLRR